MRVLIDFTQIPLSRTGVGVYADHLIGGLLPLLGSQDALILVAQSDDNTIRDMVRGHPKVCLKTVPAKIFRRRVLLLALEQVVLPLVAWANRAHLIHSLHYTHPLLSLTPRVVTVHDMTFFLFPELHTAWRQRVMRFFAARALKNAEGVLFVSEATRRDADRLFPQGRGLRRVAPLGVSSGRVIEVAHSGPISALRSLGISQPYLLFVGTLEPRKNIVRIVQAFERVAVGYQDLTLVLAGKPGWHTGGLINAIEGSPMRSRIHRLGFVSGPEKDLLLRNCAVLVYPSLYEGFGLPILEGMAAGAPVITSNSSSMPEVAGDGAILVDPSSVEDIASAIQELLSDQEKRSQLVGAGLRNSQRFTWEQTALATYQAYLDSICQGCTPASSRMG